MLKCHIFLKIFSRRQIDICRFISKDNGFDISCKLHEIPKPIFQEKRTIFKNENILKCGLNTYELWVLSYDLWLLSYDLWLLRYDLYLRCNTGAHLENAHRKWLTLVQNVTPKVLVSHNSKVTSHNSKVTSHNSKLISHKPLNHTLKYFYFYFYYF